MELLNIKKIILGSNSPRRSNLLKSIGLSFEIRKIDIEETYPKNLSPIKIAEFLSKKKSDHQEISENEILICADTLVFQGDKVYGKPKNKKNAKNMLIELSGKSHYVVTGVTLRTSKKTKTFHETTQVFFKELSELEIEHYITKYEPFDKAGSYGIQEWLGHIGINKIIGSFNNVMGLPTQKLYTNLKKLINE